MQSGVESVTCHTLLAVRLHPLVHLGGGGGEKRIVHLKASKEKVLLLFFKREMRYWFQEFIWALELLVVF